MCKKYFFAKRGVTHNPSWHIAIIYDGTGSNRDGVYMLCAAFLFRTQKPIFIAIHSSYARFIKQIMLYCIQVIRHEKAQHSASTLFAGR